MFSFSSWSSFRLPTRFGRLFAGAAASLAVLGCESTDNPRTATGPGDVALAAANNYSAVLKLDVADHPFDPAVDLTIDWSAVSNGTNLRKQPALSIELLAMVQFNLGANAALADVRAAAVAAVENGTIGKRSVQQVPVTVAEGETSRLLSMIVNPATYFAPPNPSVFLLSFSNGDTGGKGVQSLAFLVPTPGTPSAPIVVRQGSENLVSFAPTLGAAVDIRATKPGEISWGDVGVNGVKQPLDDSALEDINRVLVAYFEGKATTDLQAQDFFFNLESNATELYQATISHEPELSTTVALSSLKSPQGSPFNGFNRTNGTWVFAAMCDACTNPATILSVLNPVGE